MNQALEKEKMFKEEYQNQILDTKKEEILKLKFDLSIIELLGSQLYTKLPSIICEFVSNSYDADSTIVEVTINENDLGETKNKNNNKG
ncbi:MAG: hypothetical protein ACLUG3_03720 [Bacilli bacterium]